MLGISSFHRAKQSDGPNQSGKRERKAQQNDLLPIRQDVIPSQRARFHAMFVIVLLPFERAPLPFLGPLDRAPRPFAILQLSPRLPLPLINLRHPGQ